MQFLKSYKLETSKAQVKMIPPNEVKVNKPNLTLSQLASSFFKFVDSNYHVYSNIKREVQHKLLDFFNTLTAILHLP
jgi:hypothetical protein